VLDIGVGLQFHCLNLLALLVREVTVSILLLNTTMTQAGNLRFINAAWIDLPVCLFLTKSVSALMFLRFLSGTSDDRTIPSMCHNTSFVSVASVLIFTLILSFCGILLWDSQSIAKCHLWNSLPPRWIATSPRMGRILSETRSNLHTVVSKHTFQGERKCGIPLLSQILT